jgi:hypothetical protein
LIGSERTVEIGGIRVKLRGIFHLGSHIFRGLVEKFSFMIICTFRVIGVPIGRSDYFSELSFQELGN